MELAAIGEDNRVSLDPPARFKSEAWFNRAAFAAGDIGPSVPWAWAPTSSQHLILGHGIDQVMRVGTDMSVQFRAEIFNILNHVNFANPGTAVNSASFGRITTTLHENQGDPRIMQFGLKFVFLESHFRFRVTYVMSDVKAFFNAATPGRRDKTYESFAIPATRAARHNTRETETR